MDEALDAGLDLDKGTKVGQSRDRAGNALADGEADGLPGFRLKLLEAEGYFLRLWVDFEDAKLKLLADVKHIFRFGDAGVRNIRDMQQTVNASQVNKSAIRHQGPDGSCNGIAFFQSGVASCGYSARLLFQHHAPIDDNVFLHHIQFRNAAGNLRADQLFQLGGIFGSAAAGGHKGSYANVHRRSALAHLSQCADHRRLLGKGLFQS